MNASGCAFMEQPIILCKTPKRMKVTEFQDQKPCDIIDNFMVKNDGGNCQYMSGALLSSTRKHLPL